MGQSPRAGQSHVSPSPKTMPMWRCEVGTTSLPQAFLQVQEEMKENTILKLFLIRQRKNENIQLEGESPMMKNLVSCFSLKYNFSQMDLICTVAFVILSLFCNHIVLLSLMRKYCNCLCLILYLCYGSLLPSLSPKKNLKKNRSPSSKAQYQRFNVNSVLCHLGSGKGLQKLY